MPSTPYGSKMQRKSLQKILVILWAYKITDMGISSHVSSLEVKNVAQFFWRHILEDRSQRSKSLVLQSTNRFCLMQQLAEYPLKHSNFSKSLNFSDSIDSILKSKDSNSHSSSIRAAYTNNRMKPFKEVSPLRIKGTKKIVRCMYRKKKVKYNQFSTTIPKNPCKKWNLLCSTKCISSSKTQISIDNNTVPSLFSPSRIQMAPQLVLPLEVHTGSGASESSSISVAPFHDLPLVGKGLYSTEILDDSPSCPLTTCTLSLSPTGVTGRGVFVGKNLPSLYSSSPQIPSRKHSMLMNQMGTGEIKEGLFHMHNNEVTHEIKSSGENLFPTFYETCEANRRKHFSNFSTEVDKPLDSFDFTHISQENTKLSTYVGKDKSQDCTDDLRSQLLSFTGDSKSFPFGEKSLASLGKRPTQIITTQFAEGLISQKRFIYLTNSIYLHWSAAFVFFQSALPTISDVDTFFVASFGKHRKHGGYLKQTIVDTAYVGDNEEKNGSPADEMNQMEKVDEVHHLSAHGNSKERKGSVLTGLVRPFLAESDQVTFVTPPCLSTPYGFGFPALPSLLSSKVQKVQQAPLYGGLVQQKSCETRNVNDCKITRELEYQSNILISNRFSTCSMPFTILSKKSALSETTFDRIVSCAKVKNTRHFLSSKSKLPNIYAKQSLHLHVGNLQNSSSTGLSYYSALWRITSQDTPLYSIYRAKILKKIKERVGLLLPFTPSLGLRKFLFPPSPLQELRSHKYHLRWSGLSKIEVTNLEEYQQNDSTCFTLFHNVMTTPRFHKPIQTLAILPKTAFSFDGDQMKFRYTLMNGSSLLPISSYTGLISAFSSTPCQAKKLVMQRNRDNIKDSFMLPFLFLPSLSTQVVTRSVKESTDFHLLSPAKLRSWEDKKSIDLQSKKYYDVFPGQFITYGDSIANNSVTTESGQVLFIDSHKTTLRKAQTVLIYSQAIITVLSGEWIKKGTPLMSLSYQKLVTGDIVQGLPKIEQFFEAPVLKEGNFWSDSLQAKLNQFFQEQRKQLPLAEAVRRGFLEIQRVLVEGVQRVYISQGVLIADKHLEVIVRQMTCKGRILYSGDTGFLRNELVSLDKIENVNQVTYGQKALYHPQVRGITDASLESESFLSAASFQETTRVLSRDAIVGKTDLMRGLKERVIVGELIQAGTGLANNSVYNLL